MQYKSRGLFRIAKWTINQAWKNEDKHKILEIHEHMVHVDGNEIYLYN